MKDILYNMNFCDVCNSRLSDVTTDVKLYFQCSKCQKVYDSKPENTLMYTESIDRKDSMNKYNTFLNNAAFDQVNPLTDTKCPVCDNKYTRHVIIGGTKKFIYVCTCGHRF